MSAYKGPNIGHTLLDFPDANRGAAVQQLAKAIGVEAAHSTTIAGQSRVENIAGYLFDIGVKSIIVEYPYTDSDYLDAFAAYYAKCHTFFPRWCRRLHFFGARLTEDVLSELV